MDELLKTFHVDVKLMIAQLVNFVIVLAVLYKFAYGPISKALTERTEKIEKGLKDAKEANKKLEESTQKQEDIMKKARLEGQAIIDKSQNQAKKSAAEITGKAQEQADKALKDAQEKIQQEKEKATEELRKEVGQLVVTATEKVIGEKMDESKDKELVKNAIERMK